MPGNRTPVARVTGGNTHHYTSTDTIVATILIIYDPFVNQQGLHLPYSRKLKFINGFEQFSPTLLTKIMLGCGFRVNLNAAVPPRFSTQLLSRTSASISPLLKASLHDNNPILKRKNNYEN